MNSHGRSSCNTIQEIAEEVGMSKAFEMEDLCICRVSIKSIPKVLAEQQNQFYMEITHEMLVCENHDPDFMKTIVIGERRGFMVTTQKPSSSHLNRNSQKSLTCSQQCEGNDNLFL